MVTFLEAVQCTQTSLSHLSAFSNPYLEKTFHHTAADESLPARLVARQVVQEGEEGRGQRLGERIRVRRSRRRQAYDTVSNLELKNIRINFMSPLGAVNLLAYHEEYKKSD